MASYSNNSKYFWSWINEERLIDWLNFYACQPGINGNENLLYSPQISRNRDSHSASEKYDIPIILFFGGGGFLPPAQATDCVFWH